MLVLLPASSASDYIPPPLCRSCRAPTTRHVTRSSNRKGNAGRPYYKCLPLRSIPREICSSGRTAQLQLWKTQNASTLLLLQAWP
ncbi:hypothetical protein LZ32DRAFT_183773 [Colletotrichum eremochloae]|nr:hypothetical protein LZ32DRAFT_183773 [Colletotrichum eremochloae]